MPSIVSKKNESPRLQHLPNVPHRSLPLIPRLQRAQHKYHHRHVNRALFDVFRDTVRRGQIPDGSVDRPCGRVGVRRVGANDVDGRARVVEPVQAQLGVLVMLKNGEERVAGSLYVCVCAWARRSVGDEGRRWKGN